MIRRIVKRVLINLGSIILSCIITGCSIINTPNIPPFYQDTINSFLLIKPGSQDFPQHLFTPDPIKLDTDFNPNQYLTVLKHLSLQPGYILDYVVTTQPAETKEGK